MTEMKSPKSTSAKARGMQVRSQVRAGGGDAYVIRLDRETITR